MEFKRASGILLHISSLPSLGGIGDLGPAAFEFLSFLEEARQHVWQVLPLCPTGYGNSPYAGTSAFAGNPLLISLEFLADWGWIEKQRLASLPDSTGTVDFAEVEKHKLPLLFEAAGNFLDRGPNNPFLRDQWRLYEEFCHAEADWLMDYAFYAEIRRQYKTGNWLEWPEPLMRRNPKALAMITARFSRALGIEKVLQFAFAVQWNQLRQSANSKGIRILGDIAIFVAMDSADVWTHPGIFELDEGLKPIRVAGVPPDYFSATGQRWGNPLYRWDVLAMRDYDWWVKRMRRARGLYDIIRLDHFRGFEAYWAIPAHEETAIRGEWVGGPGAALFESISDQLGPLPLVAEDLGVITPEVDALRHQLGLPGMKVLQFGFDGPGARIHLPHHFTPQTVSYTGTHDNDTIMGWWRSADEMQRGSAEVYLGPTRGRPAWPFIRANFNSVAQIAIAPAQDILELGSEARMNVPAVASGNWRWRAPDGGWTQALADELAALVELSDRGSDPLDSSLLIERR